MTKKRNTQKAENKNESKTNENVKKKQNDLKIVSF